MPQIRVVAGGVLAIAALALTACAEPAPPAVDPLDLPAAACPDTIRIAAGAPGPLTGHLYELLGPDARIAADGTSVTGSLVAGGTDTGVEVSVLVGMPDDPRPVRLLHDDVTIFLAAVDADELLGSPEPPAFGLYAPFARSADAVLWDPSALPAVSSIADLGAAGVPVHLPPGPGSDHLVASGILPTAVVGADPGAAFLAAQGAAARLGSAVADPYLLEHETPGWLRPVAVELLDDAGYPQIPGIVSVLPANVEAYVECFDVLVPILQGAAADYDADPAATDALMAEVAAAAGLPALSDDALTAAHAALADLGLRSEGAVDAERFDALIGMLDPGADAAALVTGEYLD